MNNGRFKFQNVYNTSRKPKKYLFIKVTFQQHNVQFWGKLITFKK